MKKVKEILFKSKKKAGKHFITVTKPGVTYYEGGRSKPEETSFLQLEFSSQKHTVIPSDMEYIEVNKTTKDGTRKLVVDFLRDKCKEAGSALVEITPADIKKAKMASLDSGTLSESLDKLLKNEEELNAMPNKTAIFDYIRTLGTLGFSVEELLAKTSLTRAATIEEILILTDKKVLTDNEATTGDAGSDVNVKDEQ